MLLSLLFYGYATGVFSSRKLEAASYDSIAFRFICANTHPDHDTIATFRRRFLPQLQPLFTAILVLAAEMGFLKLGTVSPPGGSKMKANASKHKALSWGHASKPEQRLDEEVRTLLKMAEEADRAEEKAASTSRRNLNVARSALRPFKQRRPASRHVPRSATKKKRPPTKRRSRPDRPKQRPPVRSQEAERRSRLSRVLAKRIRST